MATSAWFDYNGYMANKLVQVQKAEPAAGWDMAKLVKAFSDANFGGAVGAEKHFEEYGQFEDVAPNAFFNATEYFRAKAAQFYDKAPKAVTDLEVASMQLAIKKAGMSAWSHYEMFGNAENVNPSNSFDTEAYMNAKLTALNSVKDGKQWTLAELNDAFKNAGLSALEHFMLYGGLGDGEVAQKYDGKIPAAFAVPEEKKVNADVNVGKTYPLTAGFDDLTGTVGNDTFMVTVASGSKTLDAGDKIDGGTGTDTLKIYASGGSANFANTDIKNVEIVRMVGVATGDVVDVSGNADVEELWFDGGAVTTATSLRMDQKLGFTGTVTGAAITYAGVLTGTNDSATLAFENATMTVGMTVDKIENLTFEFAGKNNTNTVTAASAATLTIEGNGEATTTVTGNAGLMKSVDTTSFAGDLSLTFGVTVAADFTYTGGAGNEDVTLTNLASAKYNINLGAGDDSLTLGTSTFATGAKIDGGDGYDTLSIGTGYTAAYFEHISNFEALGLGVGGFTQDVSLFKGDIILGAFASGTLKNVGDAQDVYLTTTVTGITIAYDPTVGAASDHTLNLIFDDMNDATNTAITLTAITADAALKTLNITSEGTIHGVATSATAADAANVITSIAGATGLKTVNIDGDSDLFFTTGALTNDLTVDAGEFTGNLIFVGTAATKSLTVTGGSGNDHITGGTLADKLVGGDGDDTLVAGAGTIGLDLLEGGNGIDEFSVVGVTFNSTIGTAANAMELMVTINDFEAGESIVFGTAGAATGALAAYTGSNSTLDTIVYELMTASGAAITWFVFEKNTYVVNNSDTVTTHAIATDQVIKLVGEKDLSTAAFDSSNETLTW